MGRKHLGGLPFVDMGVDFGIDEALEGFLDFQVFVGEVAWVSRFRPEKTLGVWAGENR
jgi:hypothetical protein